MHLIIAALVSDWQGLKIPRSKQLADKKTEFTRNYLLWFVGTVFCTLVPVSLMLTYNVVPIVAGAIGFGIFAGGFSGGMSSAYKLGVKHGTSPDSD